MDLQDEFEEVLKSGDSTLFNETLRQLEKNQEDFVVFYKVVMASQDILDYEVYKCLLGPLNTFGLVQEIPRLYIKIISTLMKNQKDINILDFVGVIFSHPLSFLKRLFSSQSNSCLATSLIMFGEFLFIKNWQYESYKVMYVVSLNITLTNVFPTKEVMTKYLTVICVFFLRDGYFYSFFNGISKLRQIDKEQVEKFGSREQFEKLYNYYKVKNEGVEFSQLLCKMPYINDSEIKNFVDKIESGSQEGYLSKYVDFCKWDRYLKAIGNEVEIHDLSFVGFLKKNNLSFEINEKMVKVGEYRFRNISDNICDIIEYYKPKKEEEVKPKKKIQNKTVKETKQPAKKKVTKFKDNFTMKKAKYAIYCDILRKNYKNIDMKNELRDKIRYEKFLKLQKEHEEKKNELKKYNQAIKDLCETLREKVEANKEVNVEYTPPTINRSTKKTNWRDLDPVEVNQQRTTSLYSQRRFGKEDDILSSRSISSFDGEKLNDTKSNGQGIYRPPAPSSVLKQPPVQSNIYRPPAPHEVLKNTINKPEEETQKSTIYIPPTLRGKTPTKRSSFSSWRREDSEE